MIGAPKGIRTPVIRVKGGYPRPLDDGSNYMVSADGFKPPTAWMSTKCSIAELHTR